MKKEQTMKKTYKTPQMEVVKIQTNQQVLTSSVTVGDPYSGGGVGARTYYWDDEY